jgi:predicted Zn-dependent protease
VSEISGLEGTLTAMAVSDSNRPATLRRLAETNVELATAATRDGAPDVASAARSAAIRYYDLLLKDHGSTYERSDEAMYLDALEHERAKDWASALRGYRELLVKFPKSSYAPHAFFAVGSVWYVECFGQGTRPGTHDPSTAAKARELFDRVTQRADAQSLLYGYAWLRIGQIDMKSNSQDNAKVAFKKAGAFATQNSSMPGTSDIVAQIPDWAK